MLHSSTHSKAASAFCGMATFESLLPASESIRLGTASLSRSLPRLNTFIPASDFAKLDALAISQSFTYTDVPSPTSGMARTDLMLSIPDVAHLSSSSAPQVRSCLGMLLLAPDLLHLESLLVFQSPARVSAVFIVSGCKCPDFVLPVLDCTLLEPSITLQSISHLEFSLAVVNSLHLSSLLSLRSLGKPSPAVAVSGMA